MNEGSVMVDTGSTPFNASADDSSQVSDTQSQTGADTQDTTQDDGQGQTQTQTQDGEQGAGEGQQYTSKGTKLDPNPQSAVHQELANAKRQVQEMEQVLRSPELLKAYAKEYGFTIAEAKEQIKDDQAQVKQAFAPERFKTAKDIAEALNEMDQRYSKEVEELRKENQSLKQSREIDAATRQHERVTNQLANDVNAVAKKYPQLNPESDQYNPELEKAVAAFYQKVDVDPKTGLAKGNFSLVEIADQFMQVAGLGQQQGSQQAQTQVRVKQAGKVVTSSKSSPSEASESNDPSTAIAQRIARSLRR